MRYLHGIYLLEVEQVQFKCESVPCKESHLCREAAVPTCAQTESNNAVPHELSCCLDRHGVQKAPLAEVTSDTTHRLESKGFSGCSSSLWRLSFSPQVLPGVCQSLLQRYPCLRSPIVLCRIIQRVWPEKRASTEPHSFSPAPPPISRVDQHDNFATSIPTEASRANPVSPCYIVDNTSEMERVSFAALVVRHFRGFWHLVELLQRSEPSGGRCSQVLTSCSACGCTEKWRDVGGRLAVTEAGAAAVDAGLSPQEAAEIYADVFAVSALGETETLEC